MKRSIIIVNPQARSGGGETRWIFIEKIVRELLPDIIIEKTSGPLHATHLAREAVENGIENIIAAGGDGTFHEVLNGLFKDDRLINPNVTYGVIGIGTGRDTLRSLGVGLDPNKQINVIKSGKTRFFDVGKVELLDIHGHPRVRYFYNGASFGMGAS